MKLKRKLVSRSNLKNSQDSVWSI